MCVKKSIAGDVESFGRYHLLFREGLKNKVEKCSADVSLDVFTERRVEPDDVSLSVASRSCRLFVCVVGQCFRIAAGFQS